MKHLSKLIFLTTVLATLLVSCKKDEHKDYFEGGANPVLTSTVTGTIPLSYANRNNQALALNWTNPEYSFTTGVSSQDVNYLVEIDTTGSGFTNPNRKQIAISKDLTTSFTVSDLNDFLLNQLVLTAGAPHNIEMRVKATIGSSEATALYSNILAFTNVVPYAIPPKVTPPGTPPNYLDGTLFIVGSATAGGWNNPITVDPTTQQFTRVSATFYTITIPLIGDGEYKLIGVNDGSWTKQWSVQTEQPSGDPSTLNADLYFNGANCRAPIVGGTYKIDVDFQRGKLILTKL